MVCAGAATAAPTPPAAVPVDSPQGQLHLALTDLAREEGRARSLETQAAAEPARADFLLAAAAGIRKNLLFYRYISFLAVPAADRPEFRRKFRYWLNHLSAARTPVPEYEVPGAQGSLIRLDIRDAPNWTRVGWAVVADRDYLFREPLLPNRETVYGRLVTGIEANPDTLAAGFILSGYQLFRDTLEADRTPSYYDLLYAAERHPDPDDGNVFVAPTGPPAIVVPDPGPEPVPPQPRQMPRPRGGPLVQPQWYYDQGEWNVYQAALANWKKAKAAFDQAKVVPVPVKAEPLVPKRLLGVKDANKGDKNFPAKGVDFERRWDGEVKAEDIKRLRIDPRVGGIAAGADGDAKHGSYVALNDRAIRIVPTRFGFVGRTFDVLKNEGDKDHIERFREIALGLAKADGGELLASLPNGAQAGLLVNANDARVEVADTRLAQIKADKIDPRYRDVRTHMGCMACHAPTNGFISFVEQYKESAEKGVKFLVREEDRQAVRDFYESWAEDVKMWQAPYARYLERTTRDAKGKPWTGAQAWEAVRKSRDWYDQPVTIETAALEFGLPVETLRQKLLGAREADSPIDVRLNQLATGKGVPRRTWEAEVAAKLAAYLDSIKGQDEPLKELLAPEIINDAIKRFGKVEKPK